MRFLHQLLVPFSFSIMATGAMADPQCTDQPKAQWQNSEAFQQKLIDDGYTIKKFKTTKGNCFEIYGYNRDKKRVEIYYNPVNGEAVKTEIED